MNNFKSKKIGDSLQQRRDYDYFLATLLEIRQMAPFETIGAPENKYGRLQYRLMEDAGLIENDSVIVSNPETWTIDIEEYQNLVITNKGHDFIALFEDGETYDYLLEVRGEYDYDLPLNTLMELGNNYMYEQLKL